MPANMDEAHFKERCYVAQLSAKVAAEQRKAVAELFNLLAEKMGPSNVRLSASSEWAKENGQHVFIELLAYYRHYIPQFSLLCSRFDADNLHYPPRNLSQSSKR